jgi:hypothetical protein
MQTNEGAFAFEHSLDHCLEFFSKAGSLYENKTHFYDNNESALSLFQKAYISDKETSLKLLFWLRNCRGGAGNRSAFRSIIKWLGINDPETLNKNIPLIPKYGRWDDLRSLYKTKSHKIAVEFWAEALRNKDILAAKWADRTDIPVGKRLGFKKEAEMRKYLVSIRKEHIVEDKLTHRNYQDINYSHVPSLAIARYTNAFKRNDEERFNQYKKSVKSGEEKINTQVLFPHDCVRTAINGDEEIADLQFDNLPNYLENTQERIIAIADSSGSMGTRVSGSIEAVHVAKGLALYCSAKIPENNIFHKKFIEFSCESDFKNWEEYKFSEAVNNYQLFSGAMGSTRIDTALNLILNTARMYNLGNDQMPTALIILSDMQFHDGTAVYRPFQRRNSKVEYAIEPLTEIERSLKVWDVYGYKRPKIIYWNLAGYPGQQDIVNSENVALVSGFSPSILKSIFNGEIDKITPYSIMMDTISQYEVCI